VVLKVYDILGKEIIELLNENKEAGVHQIEFNAQNLPSGTYIYRISAGDKIENKKMILLK